MKPGPWPCNMPVKGPAKTEKQECVCERERHTHTQMGSACRVPLVPLLPWTVVM